MKPRVILASRSPRRHELLKLLVDDFVIIVSDVEEALSGTPEHRVLRSAELKARAVGTSNPGIVIGADTLVAVDDEVLGKPESVLHARQMLLQLSGRSHRVLSGLYVWNTHSDQSATACVETRVTFRELEDTDLDDYLASGEPFDKAGAYGIQGRAAAFVAGIQGEYTNVVGLPLCTLRKLLREVGLGL